MRNKNDLKNEIDLVSTLKLITQSYEEISVMRMKKNRESVLQMREFLAGLGDVFFHVKRSHMNYLLRLEKKNKQKLEKKDPKTATVFISANTKLYGDIITKVFNLFIADAKKTTNDIIIVGKLGKELFEQEQTGKQYFYFEIPDDDITMEDLKPLVLNLTQYDKINVFYGKFQTILNQEAASSNVTGDEPLLQSQVVQNQNGQQDAAFLFEPSVEDIYTFFETQLFTSFLKQTLHESQLARFASRIKAMEEAIQNIDVRMNGLFSDQRKLVRRIDNKKQIEMLSGMALWK